MDKLFQEYKIKTAKARIEYVKTLDWERFQDQGLEFKYSLLVPSCFALDIDLASLPVNATYTDIIDYIYQEADKL